MKKLYLLLSLAVSVLSMNAQNCVTIESILVDACTLGSGCSSSADPTCNCEGKNEMFRFSVGDNGLDANDLSINWPNNSFQGLCQNATTAQNVSELNATIEACGWLKEPENGLLPAGSQVLVITSADMCTESNSFASLSDTLLVLFQCPGNFMGHFANYGSGLRTTTISFGGGCLSTATYDRGQLVAQNGFPGAEDGATVDFPTDASPVYYNNGCNAPVPVEIVDAGEETTLCLGSDSEIQLDGFLQGNFSDFYWSGGTGTFSDPNSLNTTYTPSPGDDADFVLTLDAVNCNGVVNDELMVNVITESIPVISPEGPLSLCPDETLNLSTSGEGVFTWEHGDIGPNIIVTEPGVYTVTLVSECGTASDSVVIEESLSPAIELLPGNPADICSGESVELSVSGDGDIEWSTGAETSSIIVDEPGVYSVLLTNSCGTAEETITVSLLPEPELTLLSESEVLLCEGASTALTASGQGDFSWNTGETTSEIIVDQTGLYTVTLSNACGSESADILVEDGGSLPEAEISVIGNLEICTGESTLLVGSGSGDLSWNNGTSESDLEVFLPGTFTLTVTNNCGSDEMAVTITQPAQPTVLITAGDSTAICANEPLQLAATSNLPVTWSNGITANSIEVNTPGLYYAWVENICDADTAFIIVQNGNPESFFTASTDTGAAPLDVFFTNQSEDVGYFSWIINGNEVSTETDLDYTFNNAEPYNVTLIATDAVGCSDSYTVTITPSGCETALFIPNTFTPNEDGINDLFKFTTQCIETYELRIYNRWGTMLYEGSKGSPFWDGNNGHGSYVVDGVYIYTIRYININNQTKEKNGTITIFR